jgi:hypothetical protein
VTPLSAFDNHFSKRESLLSLSRKKVEQIVGQTDHKINAPRVTADPFSAVIDF